MHGGRGTETRVRMPFLTSTYSAHGSRTRVMRWDHYCSRFKAEQWNRCTAAAMEWTAGLVLGKFMFRNCNCKIKNSGASGLQEDMLDDIVPLTWCFIMEAQLNTLSSSSGDQISSIFWISRHLIITCPGFCTVQNNIICMNQFFIMVIQVWRIPSHIGLALNSRVDRIAKAFASHGPLEFSSSCEYFWHSKQT